MKKALIFLFLSSCMLGPDYERADVCIPCEYEEAPSETDCMDLSVWWDQFNDTFLSELIEEALCSNFDLQIALHKIEEVRAFYRIDSSILYPQIQSNMVEARSRRSENLGSNIIESTSSPTELLPSDFSGPLIQNFYQVGFDASWELDFFGKNRRKAQAACHDLEASQEEALDVQISLISDVARSYIDIRTFQGQIDTKVEEIQRQQELLDLAQIRYDAGLTSYLDVANAEGRLDASESTLPPHEEALKQTLHGLAILLGRPPEQFCVGEGDIPLAEGLIPHDLPSDLLCRRPDIRKADREVAAATSRIGQAKAELFPTFSLLGSFGTQANLLDQVFVWPSRFWSIGPTMVWNLFTGGKLIAQIEVTNQRQKQAILNYERAVTSALRDVEDRLVGYFKEQKRLDSLQKLLVAVGLTRDLSLEQYFSGLIPFDNVLDSEKDFFLTREELIQSQGTLMIQLVGLYKALGGGWQCIDSL